MNEAEARAIANIMMELLDAHLAAADVIGNMKEYNLRDQLARRRARQTTNEGTDR